MNVWEARCLCLPMAATNTNRIAAHVRGVGGIDMDAEKTETETVNTPAEEETRWLLRLERSGVFVDAVWHGEMLPADVAAIFGVAEKDRKALPGEFWVEGNLLHRWEQAQDGEMHCLSCGDLAQFGVPTGSRLQRRSVKALPYLYDGAGRYPMTPAAVRQTRSIEPWEQPDS